MSAPNSYPSLDLVFDESPGDSFLVDARFWLLKGKRATHKLIENPPRGNVLRPFCILMLLAKYQGERAIDESEPPFTFFSNTNETTWIMALSESFANARKQNFCEKYFNSVHFVMTGRGGLHNFKKAKGLPPSAIYHHAFLKPANVRIYKKREGDDETPVRGEELTALAGKLEQFEIDRHRDEQGVWKQTVPDLVRKIKLDWPKESSKGGDDASSQQSQEQAPYILSARWRELGNEVRKRIEGKVTGGSWYVICVTPSWILDWKGIFFDCVRHHNGRIKFAYHSPTAAKDSLSVGAQWRMNIKYVGPKKPIDFIRGRLSALKAELSSWVAAVQAERPESNGAEGGFQFFESYIAHPFTAILSVPSPVSSVSTPSKVAPPGTTCLLLLHPFYPATLDDRCGLYLSNPSPMLDVYYNSVLAFFEEGPKDGYLKPVNLQHFGARKKTG